LHDHRRGDDGRDTQLHQGALVGGEDDAEPVKRIGAFLSVGAVEGDLAADQVDEQRDSCPEQFLFESLLLEGGLNLGQVVAHGLNQVDKS